MDYLSLRYFSKIKTLSINPIILITLLVFVTITFFTLSNLNSKKNQKNEANLNEITTSNEFANLKNGGASVEISWKYSDLVSTN